MSGDSKEITDFLIKAKRATYAGKGAETVPTRPKSQDLVYREGDFMYYAGRVTGENFSGDFLKAALFNVPAEKPFRGPEEYSDGDYCYRCAVSGDFGWFCGSETICFKGQVIYECSFHGGIIL